MPRSAALASSRILLKKFSHQHSKTNLSGETSARLARASSNEVVYSKG